MVKSYKGRGNEIFTIDFFMKVPFSVFEGLSISPTYVSGSFIQDFVSQYRYNTHDMSKNYANFSRFRFRTTSKQNSKSFHVVGPFEKLFAILS